MYEPVPDRRWRKVADALRKRKAPETESLKRVYSICAGKVKDEDQSYEHQVIREAVDLIQLAEDREVLMMFFLSGATDDEISKSLAIQPDVVLLVRQLIFDREEFRNKLELRRYTRKYMEDVLSKENVVLLQYALNIGPSYLISFFRHGHEEVQVDTSKYGRMLLEQAAQKGLTAKFNPIISEASRLARDWSKDAASMIMNADKMGFGDEISDRAQALLDEEDTTTTPEELGISLEDIQH